MKGIESLLLGNPKAVGSAPLPPLSTWARVSAWCFPIYEVELRGADLFTKMGRFGKSRKENAIIITLQNL